jgi:hypothetical protein
MVNEGDEDACQHDDDADGHAAAQHIGTSRSIQRGSLLIPAPLADLQRNETSTMTNVTRRRGG